MPLRLAAASVGLMVCLIFLPVLGAGFVNWDDGIYVNRAPLAKTLASAFTTFHASGNWHPLTTLSHAVDHAVWGMWPAGHHWTSLLLHGLNAGLVVLLVSALIRARTDDCASRQSALLTAVVTGLLWGLHPLRVESVAWISERKDLLCATFYLLGLLAYLAYLGHASTPSRRWYAGAIACLALALLSKPMAVSFPLVLLVLDAFPLGRLRRPGLGRVLLEKLPFIVLSTGSALLTLVAQRAGGAMRALDGVPFSARALVAIQTIASYLGKTLMPAELRALYSYPQEVSLLSWQFTLPLLMLGTLAVASARLRTRQPLVAATLAAYLAMLLPVMGIVQVGPQAMAERYTYLPGIGLALLAAALFGGLWEMAASSRRLLTAALLAILVGQSWLSIRQIGVWHDSERLWTQVLAYEPGSTEAHNSRADDYYQRGRYADALADYTAALASLPAVGPVHALKRRAAFWNDRAVTFVQLGRLPEAIADQTEAIRLQPARPDYYLNRARMLRLVGRPDEVTADVQQARALQAGRQHGKQAPF